MNVKSEAVSFCWEDKVMKKGRRGEEKKEGDSCTFNAATKIGVQNILRL
jgi:hypothetical protein